jgi:hypothetical protein
MNPNDISAEYELARLAQQESGNKIIGNGLGKERASLMATLSTFDGMTFIDGEVVSYHQIDKEVIISFLRHHTLSQMFPKQTHKEVLYRWLKNRGKFEECNLARAIFRRHTLSQQADELNLPLLEVDAVYEKLLADAEQAREFSIAQTRRKKLKRVVVLDDSRSSD